MPGQLVTDLLADPAELDRERAAWDALAVDASRPYCAPGWAMPWWLAARSPGSELRAVAVRDGTRLVGLAPFEVSRDRYDITSWSLLGAGVASYLEPLAPPDATGPVADAIATALAGADRDVDVVSFNGVPRTSPWPDLLCRAWPGRQPRLSLAYTIRAPYIDIPDGGHAAWLASRSANFRQQVRRRRRDFVRRGGQFRQATSPTEVSTALDSFERLHRQRWQERGGSRALTGPVVAMLRQAATAMHPNRLQLWTAQVDGHTVGAALFVAAGQQVHYWLGGFDEQWARWTPSLLLLDQIVRHAATEGCARVSLGPGSGAYKYRFATGEDVLQWVDLLPRGRRYPYVRLCQSPYRLYRVAANRTPPGVKRRLKLGRGER